MDTFVTFSVAAAWLAIIGMLAWGVVRGWRGVMSDEGTLPFFGMLERRGLVFGRLEQAPEAVYLAVRRCTMCREKVRCRDWLDRRSRSEAPDCPNADFMDTAARLSPAA
jgi:hypothetical protein